MATEKHSTNDDTAQISRGILNKVEIAPGVYCTTTPYGHYLEGTKAALVASGHAESEWFSDWSEKNKRGEVVRSKRFFVGGIEVSTTAPAKGECYVRFRARHYLSSEYIEQVRYEDAHDCNEGIQKITWQECAWRPTRA